MALLEWSLWLLVCIPYNPIDLHLTPVIAEYVILLTGRELKGQLMGHNIYRATEFDIIPLNPDVSITNPPNVVEAHLLALVRSHLNGGNFLFSYGWDITRRLQAQWATYKQDEGKAMWEVVSISLQANPVCRLMLCV